MASWISILVGAVVVWGAAGYLRHTLLPRRRLEKFLAGLGVKFVRVKTSPAYGWPGYVVVFQSLEESGEFRESSSFEALVHEVQRMHGSLQQRAQQFDARMAVSVVAQSLGER